MAEDKLSAALEEIRWLVAARDALVGRMRTAAVNAVEFNATQDRLANRLPSIVAALDAVLKLADEAGSVLSFPPADCTNACGDGPCNCSGESRPAGWDLDPEAVREVITRELTGEAGDGD